MEAETPGGEQLAGRNDAEQDRPRTSSASLARLGAVWLTSAMASGFAMGGGAFSEMFAEAGLFADLCSEKLCREQDLFISGILAFAVNFSTLASFPSGILFDSMGARTTGVLGLFILFFGVLLLIASLSFTFGSRALFVAGLIATETGTAMNNMAFYGLLWHLPGWQLLLLALSWGCIPIGALLPLIMQAIMTALGWSLVDAFVGYSFVICACACVCWLAVPSLAEYYAQAQVVLGVPVPRPPKPNCRKFMHSVRMAFRVLDVNKFESVMVFFFTICGGMSLLIYSNETESFGHALFGDVEAGKELTALYIKVTSAMGLVGVPLVAVLVEFTGFYVLAGCNAVGAIVTWVFCGSASWIAQYACIFFAAFSTSSTAIFLTKYIIGFCPPNRLGTVQGVFVMLFGLASIPLCAVMPLWTNAFGEGTGAAAFVTPARIVGVPSLVGWTLYSARLLFLPLPGRVFLEEDEAEVMMETFQLQSLAEAEEVLAMDRTEILRLACSTDVLDMRAIVELMSDPEVQDRLATVRARGERCPTPVSDHFSFLENAS